MGNQRILIIDDEPETLELCTFLLRRKGYEVMAHSGCDNLFAIVEEFSPHLIFMDHNMPHLCGTDAIQLLKSQTNFKHIPIILFSAENNIEQLAKEAGADSWLKKPFASETMLTETKRMALVD
jgi:two-component system cell cycle response regulator DivK